MIFLLPKTFRLFCLLLIYQKRVVGTKIDIYVFYYYLWVDTSAVGLLVPEGFIRPTITVSVLTWFIRYIY